MVARGRGEGPANPLGDLSLCESPPPSKIYGSLFARPFATVDIEKPGWGRT